MHVEDSPSKTPTGQEQDSFSLHKFHPAFTDASKTAKVPLISVGLLWYSQETQECCSGANFFLICFFGWRYDLYQMQKWSLDKNSGNSGEISRVFSEAGSKSTQFIRQRN